MSDDVPIYWTDENKARNDLLEAVLDDVRKVMRESAAKAPLVVPRTAGDVPKLEQDTGIGDRGAFEMLKQQQVK